MTQLEALHRSLNHWILRLRLARGVRWLGRGLAAGLAAGLALAWLGLLRDALLRSEFLQLVAAAGLGGAALGGLAAFAWPIPRMRAARFFDRQFGLRDRVSTALELVEREPDQQTILQARQLQDAVLQAQRVNPRRLLPLQMNWKEGALALFLVAAGLLSAHLGERHFSAAGQRRVMQSAIAAETARIEALQNQVEQNPALTAAQREALAAPLEEARRQLDQARSLEESVSILTETESKLRALAEPQGAFERLREVGGRLSQLQGSPLQQAGRDLAAGAFQNAAQAVMEIDPAEMDPVEQGALADQLEQAALALAESSPELAERLRQSAQALRSGDEEAARQTLQEAGQALAASGEAAAQAEAASNAADQAGAGRQRLLAQGSESPAGSGPQTGQAAAPSTGSGGQAGDAGQPGEGSGRGESGTAGEAGEGVPAGAAQEGAEGSPGDGGEQTYAPLTGTEGLGGGDGQEVSLPPSGQAGDQAVGQGAPLPEPSGRSRVPYTQVYPEYAAAYRRAVENGQVPFQFQDVVREYFSSLEP